MSDSLTIVDGQNQPSSISTAGDQFFFRLAKEIKAINTTLDMANCLSKLNKWKESINKLTDHVKDKTLELIKSQGKKVTEKGSYELVIDNIKLRARPVRTGVDPKKLEALLRARSIDTGIAMDMEIKYSINADKLAYCLVEGILTEQDIELCEYEESYAVMPPERIS